MQLTLYSDYSLRTLIYLALSPDGATVAEIAERFRISHNHLTKVVHNLGKLGYVRTTRGRSGGLVLARSPGEINVGEVVRQVEPHFNLVECFDPAKNTCPILPACALRGVLGEAQEAFLKVLDGYWLSDFRASAPEVARLLGLAAVSAATPET